MSANAEIIAELRRVLNERDEAREQLDLTKRELGRWVDRETKAVRERDSYQRQLDAIGDALVTSIVKRIEPRLSRHPVTVIMAAGSLFAKIGESIGCEFEDGDDLLEAVKELVRERDEAIKARDQYLRERDQARMAEKRARESLDELDGAIYDCLPSDYDDDSPLDCVEHAADQLQALAQERDEARAEVERLREMAHDFEAMREDRDAAIARITEVGVMVATNGNALAKEAYRRGAEAMREACIGYCHKIGFHGLTVDLRALPIPEEP